MPVERQLQALPLDAVQDLAAVLFAADAVGGSQWCVQIASEYAKDRRQFGRPIGQFQGVKHRCANMLGRTELARVATWDAARAVGDPATEAFAAAAAASLAVDGYFQTAKDCVQTFGGIGFTWEHDAHVYLRRAAATRALLGSSSTWQERSARAGARRREAEAERRPPARGGGAPRGAARPVERDRRARRDRAAGAHRRRGVRVAAVAEAVGA